MKSIKVQVKAKFGSIEVEEEFDYNEPDSWKEAVDMADGNEAGEFKRYLNERKTNFQDSKRKAMLLGITKKLKILAAMPEFKAKLKEIGITV